MQRIPGFDGLRALAALAVVLTHLHVYHALVARNILTPEFVNGINGWAGVQLFFSLSGFLITLLLIREHQQKGRISLRNFYLRRLLRIVPLYMLVVILVGVLQVLGAHAAPPEGLWFAVAYMYNFVPREWYSSVLGHTWSLAVEEHFYVLWPLVLVALYPALRKLQGLLVLAVGVSLVFALIATRNEWLASRFFVERWTFVAGAFIASGALLALLLEKPRARQELAKPWAAWVALALVFVDVWLPWKDPVGLAYVRSVGFTLIIAWVYLNPVHRMVRGLEWAPLRYLGRVSYGIYMYQGFYLATGPARAAGQSWPPSPWLGLLLLCLTVPVSYHFFELPLMRLKKRWHAESVGTGR